MHFPKACKSWLEQHSFECYLHLMWPRKVKWLKKVDWLLRYISFVWDPVCSSDCKIFLKTVAHSEKCTFWSTPLVKITDQNLSQRVKLSCCAYRSVTSNAIWLPSSVTNTAVSHAKMTCLCFFFCWIVKGNILIAYYILSFVVLL